MTLPFSTLRTLRIAPVLSVTVALAVTLACSEAKAPGPQVFEQPATFARVATSASATPAEAVLAFPSGPIAGECTGAKCFESATGFRYLHPLPVGLTLASVVALGRDEALAVGDGATVLRMKGDTLTRVKLAGIRTPAMSWGEMDPNVDMHASVRGSEFWQNRLGSVVRTGPRDLSILIDSKSVARFDGERWSNEAPPSGRPFGRAMFGDTASGAVILPASEGLAPGPSKPLIRRGGGMFLQGGTTPSGVLAWSGVARGGAIWLGADKGRILRSVDGSDFVLEPLSPPANDDVVAIWIARDRRRGLAVTRTNTLYERDGETWQRAEPIADEKSGARDVEMIWSTPDDAEVWAVGDAIFRRKGNGAWQSVTVPAWATRRDNASDLFEGPRFAAIDGTASDDVWIVGRHGAVFHWDGKALRERSARYTDEAIVAILPLAGSAWLAFAKDGTVLRGNGASGPVVRDSRIEGDIDSVLRAVDGKIIVIGRDRKIWIREGDAWSSRPSIRGLSAASAALSDTVFYDVGWDGRAERVTPQGTTKVVHGVDNELHAVAFAGPRDAWIVGDGIILRGDGTRFSVFARHPHDNYRAISIRAPDDVWIAGDARETLEAGLVLHWNGKKLERFEKLHNASFWGIHASSGGQVWAVGGDGAAWFDGSKWQLADTNTSFLRAALVTPDGTVLAGGDGGAIVALEK